MPPTTLNSEEPLYTQFTNKFLRSPEQGETLA